MKSFSHKVLIILLFGFYCIPGYAQTIIQMEEYGGVFRIPCKVNGAKMKLIFDTGAESVCLSLTMAEYLFDNDLISSVDIIGTGTSSVADGRIVDHVVINLNDIEIQGIHLTNVKAVVIDGQDAPLLFGQSAIQKLGPIEINGNILTIKNGKELNEEYISKLLAEARQAYDNELYERAIEKYSKVTSGRQLSDFDIYKYARAYAAKENVRKAFEIISEIDDYSYFEENKIDIYILLGYIYMELGQYREAAGYYQLSSKKIKTENEGRFRNYISEAECYNGLEEYTTAIEKFDAAKRLFAQMHNIDMAYIERDSENKLKRNERSYRDDNIDYVMASSLLCGLKGYKISGDEFLKKITAMARANNRYALVLCDEIDLNPFDRKWK